MGSNRSRENGDFGGQYSEIYSMSFIEAQQLLQMLLINVKQAKSYKIPSKQQLSATLANLITCTARRIFSTASVVTNGSHGRALKEVWPLEMRSAT